MIEFILNIALPIIVVIAMAGVGLSVTPSYISHVVHEPYKLILAIVAQVILLPILAIFIALFGPGNVLTASVLLVLAACPGGGVSNLYTLAAGANTALSVILTLTGILVSVFTIPLVLTVYFWLGFEVGTGENLSFAFVLYLVALVGVPVSLGFAFRLAFPMVAQRWQRRLRTFTMVMIVLALGGSIWDQFDAIAASFANVLPLVFMFVVGAILAGYTVGLLLYRAPGDQFALSAEFGTRHIPIASAVSLEMQGDLAFAGPVSLYFLVEAVILLTLAWMFSQRTIQPAG